MSSPWDDYSDALDRLLEARRSGDTGAMKEAISSAESAQWSGQNILYFLLSSFDGNAFPTSLLERWEVWWQPWEQVITELCRRLLALEERKDWRNGLIMDLKDQNQILANALLQYETRLEECERRIDALTEENHRRSAQGHRRAAAV
jgi:hypothetical protein